jgi:hypothetical protein
MTVGSQNQRTQAFAQFQLNAFERRLDPRPCRDGAAQSLIAEHRGAETKRTQRSLLFQWFGFFSSSCLGAAMSSGGTREPRGRWRQRSGVGPAERLGAWAGLSGQESRAFDRNPSKHTSVPNINFFCLAAIP